MIEYLRQTYGVDRVAIVDTDCHHGDGTQDIYWHDPDTLFISVHQDGRTLYPGSGFQNEFGGPKAAGTTINLPLPPRTSEEGFLYVLENAILPILEQFKPDLDRELRRPGQPLFRPDHQHEFFRAWLRRADKPPQAAHSRSRRRIFHRGRSAIHQCRDHPGNGGTRLQRDSRTRLRTGKTAPGTGDHAPYRNSRQRKPSRSGSRAPASGKTTGRRTSCSSGTAGFSTIRTRYPKSSGKMIRACPDCSGLLTIDSQTDSGRRIFAVHIPRKACKECREAGYKAYDSTDIRRYNQNFSPG